MKDFFTLNIPCREKISRSANAFRIYILSKYPYQLWLDADIYASEQPNCNDMKFDFNNIFFKSNWSVRYNSEDTEFFKVILEKYLQGLFYDSKLNRALADHEVYAKIIPNADPMAKIRNPYWTSMNLIHLSIVDHEEEDVENWDLSELDSKHILQKPTYYTMPKHPLTVPVGNNPKLINFIKQTKDSYRK